MLDFQKSKIGKLLDEKGSAMVEYAILLAFIAVVAVLLSPEHLPKYVSEESSELTGENLSTTIFFIFLKIKILLMRAVNSL